MDIYKYSKILLLFLVANSLLSACGGNSTETSTPTVAPLPIVGTIKPSFANNQSIQARKIVSVVAANASGEFTHPFDNENFIGNLLAAINVSDPDGISAVALSFNQQTDVQYLCQNSSTCTGTSFHKTQTSINPANFGLYTGPVTIGLWVMDVNQNQMQVDSITVNWQYRKIVDVNAVRSSDGTSISLNWMPQNALLKYNIYVATQPNVNNNNYLTLTDGQARLALAQPAQTFTGLQANKSYYFFITGVDSSGESAFSSTIRMDQYAGQANTPPVANDDVVKSPEDTILTSNLLDNDSDSDNNPLTVNSIPIRAPFYGQLTLQENGDFSYVPQLNFSGNDSFEYEIQDGQGGFSQARVDIIVSSSNDAPQAVDDTYSTAKNQSITVTAPGVLSNDTDIDGDQLSINTTPITNTTHGSLVLDTDGGFTYTPNTDFVGIDRFVYQVNDPLGLNDNAQVTINVGGQNTPPTAVNDSYNTSQNTTLIVNGSPLPSILANDSDADGDTIQLSSTLISNVTNGSLTIDVNGFFTYIPNTNFSGTDSFVYQITDGQGGSAQATVTISVNSVNQAPVAVDDVASVDEDTTVSIDVLNNDSDGDGDTLTITSWQASNGTATLNTNKLDYTPNSNFNGADTLTYTIDDGNSHTSSAKVIITINPINDNPVAIDDTASMISGGSVIITVLDNDSDVDGDPLTVTSASSDSGSAIVNNDNTITFSGAITGTALITYSISDGNGGNATALITVTVNAANQAPTAVADSYSIDQDTTLSVDGVKILGLLDNDSDPENDSLTVNTAPITDVSNGTLTLNSDGTFTYIPNNGYSGSDSFEYQIDDGNSNLASALVTITINKVNTVPIANPDFYSLQPNSSISVDGTTLAHLLSNDTDADGDTLNYTGVTSTVENGTLNDSTDSTFSYIPNSNFTGVDSFFYDISDGAGGISKALTSLTVSRLIWNSTKAPLISDYQGISFDGSNYHLVANGNVLGSNNATSWTKQYQHNGTALLAIASGKTTASPSLNTTVAVGQFNKNLVRQQKVNGTFFSGSWPNRVTNTSVAMQNIILNNGQFIAVGQQAVMFSSDGINWQKQTPNTAVLFHGVVKALGQLIIVGENGSIETSVAGTTWTTRTSNTTQILRDVISNGSDLFVAVGDANTVLSSSDGITWTSRISNLSNISSDFKTIAYGNGLFLAAGNNSTVITSSDGITWTAQQGIDTQPINDVIFDGSRFILVGNQANLFVTMDGITFVPVNQGDTRNFTGIATNGTTLIRAGNPTEIYKSSDGINWTQLTTVTHAINQVEYFNGGFIAVGDSGLILTSPNGDTWTQQTLQITNNINDVFWFSGLDVQGSPFSLYVAVGNNGLLLTSSDAINWQRETAGQTPLFDNFYGVDHDNDYFVVVGQNGKILVRNNTASPGGTTWMDFFSNTAFGTLRDIIYNGTTNIIVGDGGVIVTGTAQGGNFTSLATSFNDNFSHLAFSGNRYIIGCDNGNVYTSTDGSNWLKDIARATQPILDIIISPSTTTNININKVFAVGDKGTTIVGEFK